MNLSPNPAPHIRHIQTTRGVMGDAVTALSFLYAMAVYFYGPRALWLCFVSVGVCFGCDVLCDLANKRRHNLRDFSSVVTGMMIPLMLPASVPYPIVITAGVFGIIVAKHPFGGVGHNIFNPAAAGFSFAAICFDKALFTYPPPNQALPVFGAIEFSTVHYSETP